MHERNERTYYVCALFDVVIKCIHIMLTMFTMYIYYIIYHRIYNIFIKSLTATYVDIPHIVRARAVYELDPSIGIDGFFVL